MSSRRSGGGLRTLAIPTVLVAGLVMLALTVGWTLLKNPFGTTTVDRSPPPVLTSLKSISEFHAAQGSFEVLIDLEKDVEYLPSALAGQRVLFIGVGTVDAFVDFSRLDDRAIEISDDGTAVTVTLPNPELTLPTIDPTLSHVVDRDKGLFDRVSELISGDGGDSEQDLYIAAAQKMTEAAKAARLEEQAELSTTQMLEGMLLGLGFERVQIEFADLGPPTE